MVHPRFSEMLVFAFCLVLIAACAAATPASPAPGAEPVGSEQVTEVPLTALPTLRVGVPFAWLLNEHLVAGLCDGGAELGFQIELVVPDSFYADPKGLALPDPSVCPISIANGPASFPGLFGIFCAGNNGIGLESVDLYLYDTQSVRHAIESGRLSQVSDTTATPIDPLGAAFAKEGALYGVPAGTAPLLGVANPEILAEAGYDIIKLRGDWTWANMTDVVKQLAERSDQRGTMTLPADLSLAVAACQSLLGEDCSEEAMFGGETFNTMLTFLADGNEILSQPNVAPENGDIVSNFANGQIALAVTRPGFLTALAATGYQEDIAILPFPSNPYPGGAAMGYGWVVPDASKQKSDAWKLADFLSKNENMYRWTLANGLLPGTAEGLEAVLQTGSSIAEEYLPSALLTSENELETLRGIAGNSKAWQIPSNVDLGMYQAFIELGNQLIPTLMELGKSGDSGAAVQFLNQLNELGMQVVQ